jgi:basic amino acid/polyamine antiporter, APA family
MAQLRPSGDVFVAHEGRLLKILGVGFGLAIVIGSAVGNGILRNPGIVATNLGSGWLIVAAWTIGGIISLIGANTYAELSTALPEDGGPYVFIRRAYGDFWGFAGGMADFAQLCFALAYFTITIGEFLRMIFPAVDGWHNSIGIGCLLVLAFLNWIGLRAGDLTQKLTSLIKVVALFALVAACLLFGPVDTAPATPVDSLLSVTDPLLIVGGLALAMNAVIGTYAGWNTAVYFSEENVDSSRSLPRSLFGGVATVMVIYVLVNAALVYAMPISSIAASKLPAADFISGIAGNFGGALITGLAICSVLGVMNATLMFAPRATFALSRGGFLPARLADVNKGGTPAPALFLTATLALIVALSGTYETLLEISVFIVLAIDISVYLALFVLRWKEPELPRPYRALGYPILPAIAAAAAVSILILFVIGNTTNSLISIAVIIATYPIFVIVRLIMRRSNTEVKS